MGITDQSLKHLFIRITKQLKILTMKVTKQNKFNGLSNQLASWFWQFDMGSNFFSFCKKSFGSKASLKQTLLNKSIKKALALLFRSNLTIIPQKMVENPSKIEFIVFHPWHHKPIWNDPLLVDNLKMIPFFSYIIESYISVIFLLVNNIFYITNEIFKTLYMQTR